MLGNYISNNEKWRFAICGKANSGKNTLATMIVDELGLNQETAKITALADPMKNIVKIMFPDASSDCLFGPSELRAQVIDNEYIDADNNILTYRRLLTDLGKFARAYNPDVWLNCLIKDVKINDRKQAYIVSDVRLINEFEYLKKNGFAMIRIHRDEYTKINDVSETEQDKINNNRFDYIIHNNDTLTVLKKSVKQMLLDLWSDISVY
jgi:hypothetical protein